MKKLDIAQSKEYGPLVVWANDLFDLLSELQSCKNFTFIADDTKFDSIEEFIKESRGRKPSVVQIKAQEPYLTIDLFPRWNRLYVSSSELLASGLFLKADTILSRCERKPRFLFSIVGTSIGPTTIPFLFHLQPLQPFAYLQFWLWGLAFAWLLIVGFIHFWKFCTIHPVRQVDRPSFIKRNTDSIVVAVISALLGAVGGVAATKVADRVWPSSLNRSNNTDTVDKASGVDIGKH